MPENTHATGPQRGADQYETVETLRNAEGMCTLITRKRSTGALSISLCKEFERDGQTRQSAFFARRQIDGAIELLKLTGERMDQLLDEEKASQRIAADAKTRQRRTVNGRR